VSSAASTHVELVWKGELEFDAHMSRTTMVLDSAGIAGPSPVETLAASLAGCMAMDVAHILTRGRHDLRSLSATLDADRAADNPRRIRAVTLHFAIAGAVPPDAVTRAVELSRTKYCSVWQSLRQDIDLQVTFDLTP
jgi:putative redox protein